MRMPRPLPIRLTLPLVLCLIAAPAYPQKGARPTAKRAGATLAERFKQLDRNGDGKITADESPRPEMLKLMDGDGDGGVTVDEVKAYYLSRRPAGVTTPAKGALPSPPMDKYLNIAYAKVEDAAANLLSLDVYAPKQAKGCPVMIYIHGGGWSKGDKSTVGVKADYFVRAGWVFVSINYRLAPKVSFPVYVQDVAKAVAHVHKKAGAYGGSADRIYIMGHSAGAHLAALIATDEKRLKAEGLPLSTFKGVIPLDTAAYDLPRRMEELSRGDRGMGMFPMAFGKDPAGWKDASPITHVTKGTGIAPFLIIHVASRDDSRIQSEAFAKKLRDAGGRAEVYAAEGKTHGSLNQQFGLPDDAPTVKATAFLQSLQSSATDRKLTATVLLTPAAAVESGAEWPQFHGPKRDNLSTETGLLPKWPEGGPKRLWTAKGLGHGYSSLAIADGRIFTSGDSDRQTVVTALDTEGKVLWQESNGKAWRGPTPGARSTPTIDGDRVYHENQQGEVACFEVKTGKKLWGVNIVERFHSKVAKWAQAESVLIDGDHLICCPGGPLASVVALDKLTGKTIWKAASSGHLAGYASPILVKHQGVRLIITLTAKSMIGVNADTGKLLWNVEHLSHADQNTQIPIFHEGSIYVCTALAGTVRWDIQMTDGTLGVREVWRSKEMDNHHGGVVLVDGYLYSASQAFNKGKWVCLDAKDGRRMYAEDGVGKGSLTVAEGMFYILSEKGAMGLVRATPKRHEVVSRFQIPAGGEKLSWAHPVICDGRLYLRHGEFLYAYNIRAKTP